MFQRMMNNIFRPYLDQFVNIYLDDILIFSKTLKEHLEHIKLVLEILRRNQLYGNLKKCDFLKEEIEFLGHIVSKEGIQVDPKKTKTIDEWKPLKDVHDVRSFLGLTNYYKKFIADYAKLTEPLTQLLRKDAEFQWTKERNDAFEVLKKKLTSAPVLRTPDFNLEFILTTDASDLAIGQVLF